MQKRLIHSHTISIFNPMNFVIRFLMMILMMSVVLSSPSKLLANPVEKIVILGERQKKPLETFQQIVVIDESKIPYTKLGEILNQVSGVYVNKSYGIVDQESISIRGYANSQIKILIDGVSQSEANGLDSSVLELPLSQIEAIEIHKGPSGAQNGSGTMGGTINVITKKNHKINDSKVLIGSYGKKLIENGIQHSQGDLSASLRAGSEVEKGHYRIQNSDKKDQVVENNDRTKKYFKSVLQYQKLFASTEIQGSERGVPGSLTKKTPHIREKKQSQHFMLGLQKLRISQQLQSELHFQWKKDQLWYQDPYGEYDSFETSFSTLTQVKSGKGRIEYNDDDYSLIYTFDSMLETLKLETQSYSRTTTMNSAFAQKTFWEKHLELNLSYGQTQATDLNLEKNGAIHFAGRFFDRKIIPKIIYSTGFRYPTFEELYINKGMVVGNSQLQSERNKGFEVSLETSLWKWKNQFTYFNTLANNLIVYQLVSGFQYKPFNYAKVKSTGFENSLSFMPIEDISIDWNHTIQRVVNDNPLSQFYNYYIPNKPWAFGSIAIGYMGSSFFRSRLIYSYAMSRFVNDANTKKLPNKAVFDLTNTIFVNDPFILKFDILNLTDSYHVDIRDFPSPGRQYQMTIASKF